MACGRKQISRHGQSRLGLGASDADIEKNSGQSEEPGGASFLLYQKSPQWLRSWILLA